MTEEEKRELRELRASLDAARAQLAALETRVRHFEGPEAGEAALPPAAARRVRPPRPPRPPRTPGAFERRIREFFTEGNPLNKLGAISLIVGAVLIFKYAVDNQWIGPTGRVALGFVVGGALFGVGEYFARKTWKLFASGLTGAGNGVLFVSIWFGQQQYEILPPLVAFALYVLLTAVVVVQALRYDALGLAVWGLLGGYVTPLLASTGSGNFVFLSNYLLVLNTGVFAVGYRRDWHLLKWMAFLLTAPYTAVWVVAFEGEPHSTRWLELHWLLPYLGAFFAYFAAIPTWRSLVRREPVGAFDQNLTVANGVLHFAFASALLYPDHRAWLGLVAAIVAVFYVFISSRVVRQPVVDTRALRVFAGTAAGFLLVATPYLLSGPTITLVWCAQTVFLAWACTQERFAFLRLHVLAMVGVIAVRLVGFDGLFQVGPVDSARAYLPFMQLESYPPLVAALTFALVGRFLGRLPRLSQAVTGLLGLGLLVLTFGVHGESVHWTRAALAPNASRELQNLIESGLLVAVMCALWFGLVARLTGPRIPAALGAGFGALLLLWVVEVLLWPGGYGHMTRILGHGYSLWWLHTSVLLMAPLVWLLARLGRGIDEPLGWLKLPHLRAAFFGAALMVTLLLLRREVFAITHAPPVADLFSADARLASYRMLLSLAYAFLAFGIYLNAIRTQSRIRLHAAYALYVMTALKVYIFDLESQNQLYRAFSLLIFAAILFVSSYFANRHRAANPISHA